MKNSIRRFGAVASLATMIMSVSCIFDTRDPEPPVGNVVACTLETSDQPFNCIARALSQQRDADYERSISDAFAFTPTPEDASDPIFVGKPVYEGWNKTVEMEVLGLLLSDADRTVVNFGDLEATINETQFVRYLVNYTLEVVMTASPTDTTLYKGVAEIDVRREGGNWRVTNWNETSTVADFKTWGFLRGLLRERIL